MVIIHSRKEDDYKINVDYAPLLKEWCVPLKDYLHSDRQANLMSLIYKLYLPSNLNWKYIENKKDIFKPFQLTSPKETRVVMINFNPVFNKNSNGLAFANKTSFIESRHDEELIDLFNQANSPNQQVSRLALQLIYKLRGDKYLDIQRIVEKCGFTELKFCTEFDTYKSIRAALYEPVDSTPTLANLPLTALCCIQKNGTQCPEVAVPFLNWILKEFSMFNNQKINFEAKVSYD